MTEVYRSEAAQASMNPQWNFLNASNAVLSGHQRAARRFSVEVTAHAHCPRACAVASPSRQPARRTPPSWLPSSAPPTSRSVLRAEVDLGSAAHVGGDPFLRLSPDAVSPDVAHAYKRYIERSSDGDVSKPVLGGDAAVAGAEGEAALWPCLEMLPPNTLLLALEDGYYVSQAVYDTMFHRQRLPWQVLGQMQRPTPPAVAAAAPPAVKHEADEGDTPGALEAMGPLTRRRPTAQEGSLPPPSPSGPGAWPQGPAPTPQAQASELQLPLLLQQFTQLAQLSQEEHGVDCEIAEVLRSIAEEHMLGGAEAEGGGLAASAPAEAQPTETKISGTDETVQRGAHSTAVCGGEGGPGAAEEAAASNEDDEDALDFSQKCSDQAFAMLTQLRVQLMNDLRQLYPVDTVHRGDLYRIKGVQLPEGAFNKAPAEQVGTALGHTAHCVYLAAQHLGVPLRYKPIPRASFSCMQDDVSNHEPLPLFLKNSDPAQFARAYQMLQVCVQQIARATGTKLPFGPSGHVLGNLQAVFETVCVQGAAW